MKKIIHTVHIDASPDEVFNALTTERGVTGWWSTQAKLESGVGGVITFKFFGDFHPQMKQIGLERPNLVQWKCIDGHTNWQDNLFTFKIRESNGNTSLQFVQEYARELDDDIYGTYNFNWGYYLNSLKKLCEDDKGTPFDPGKR